MQMVVIGLGQTGCGIARPLDGAGLLSAAIDAGPLRVPEADLSDRVGSDILVADILLFAVPAIIQMADVLTPEQAQGGQAVVDLTASHPVDCIAKARQLGTRGLSYVDAAMTDGAAGADVIAPAMPMFEDLAREVKHG